MNAVKSMISLSFNRTVSLLVIGLLLLLIVMLYVNSNPNGTVDRPANVPTVLTPSEGTPDP